MNRGWGILGVVAATALLIVASVGCGADTVEPGDVERDAGQTFTELVGTSPDEVSCPELEAETGASERCTVTVGDEEAVVVATVEAVNEDAEIDYLVLVIAPSELEQDGEQAVEAEYGFIPDGGVSCPRWLDSAVDASTTCVAEDEGDQLEMTATVTEADEAQASADWDWEFGEWQ